MSEPQASTPPVTALTGRSVVEVGRAPAGAYCGRLFADYGADVSRLQAINEPTPGQTDGTSSDPGFDPLGPGAAYYDRAKSVVATPEGPDRLAAAEVVIVADGHDPVSDVTPADEAQIVVRISPFAAHGPYARWRSCDLVDTAIGGHLRLSGDPDREPIQGVPDLVQHAAGVAGFVGGLAALIARARTGRGQIVDVSHQEVLTALHQFTLARYTHNGAVLNRLGNRYAGPGQPIGAYECADGWIGLALPQEDQVERMLEVTGLIAMLERPDVSSIVDLMIEPGLLDSEFVPYLKTQQRDEIVELFQALRIPCAPISELDELLGDEHLNARNFWSRPDAHGLRYPGPPFRLSQPADPPAASPTNQPSNRPAAAARQADRHPMTTEEADLSGGPLTGLRVIDMTRVWAGPLGARILADLGAEVVMTEVPWARTGHDVPQSYIQGTRFFPDDDGGDRPWNRSCFHNKYAVNKLSTVIELDKPEGRELFRALVPSADVLIENYSPRVMPGFGLDGETLMALNPDLVYVTMPGYGRDGPRSDWVAYGPTIDGHVGHTALTGYRDEEPWKCGVAWPDPIGGLHAAAGALVALLGRFTTGQGPGGRVVEVAQIESAINMIGQHVVAAQSGEPMPRRGNRHPDRAPQGVYRCAGDDRWIAVSILDDRSWRSLCRTAAELERSGGDEHRADAWDGLVDLGLDARQERHDELDRLLTELAAGRNDIELMHRLQADGIPAGAALTAPDVMGDPQLAAVGFFAELDHADAGTHPWPRLPIRLSATPATMRRPSALMGEHNEYVVRELAGYSADRYRDLIERHIVRAEPPA